MLVITCADLPSPEACCGSCHDEWDEGYGYPCGIPNNPTIRFWKLGYDLWDSEVCCAKAHTELSRPQLAQALRAARARRGERG